MDTHLFWYIVVAIIGLMFGSFAGASLWRLRARQLVYDKKHGEPYDKKEYERLKMLTKSTVKSDRSRCLACKHVLKWYDLLPLASWVSTKGKCRYCHKRIGWFEPVIELVMAGLFVAVYHFAATAGYGLDALILLLAVTIGLVILFFYDLKWLLLPNVIMWSVIALAAIWWLRLAVGSSDFMELGVSTIWSLAILSGLYLLLWFFSKGQWVGFGDVKLGLALGLLLADWKLALLTLFLANLIGTLIVIPGLMSKKLDRRSQVPFGPLLIIGFFIAFFFGTNIVEWYLQSVMLFMV